MMNKIFSYVNISLYQRWCSPGGIARLLEKRPFLFKKIDFLRDPGVTGVLGDFEIYYHYFINSIFLYKK